MWHDGTPVDMDDVLYTLTTAFTPDDIEFAEARDEIAGRTFPDSEVAMMYLKDWEAVDEKTLAINVKFPTSAFLTTFAVHRFPVISYDAGAEHGTFKVPNEGTMVGTGPYKFEKYDKDIVTELVRNDNYHIEGRPYLDGLRHYAIFDAGTIIAAYKTEQVHLSSDFVSNLKIPDVLALQEEMGEDKLRVIFASAPVASLGVMMNTLRAPFDDARVRKAVNLVLHRQPINQTISGGRNGVGTPITCGFDWSFPCEEALQMPGVRELNGEKHPDDIAEAQALALAAGAGPGTKMEFSCRLVIEFCDVMQIVKPQLNKWLGWEFTTRSLESVAGYELYRTGQYDIAIQAYSLPFPDPDALGAFLKKGATNEMGRTSYYNEKAEPLWGQISTTTDLAKRQALVREVNDILMEDNSWAIAYHLTFGWPVNTKIKGFIDPVTRSQYLLWDQIWLDK